MAQHRQGAALDVVRQDELAAAPRIVATQEGRVMVSNGETAYVRGDLAGARNFTVFRQSKPLLDPTSKEVLGYEAGYIGTADLVRTDGTSPVGGLPVPATFVITTARQEAGVGDRLVPVPARDYSAYMPHAPAAAIGGQVISVYGDAITGGQNHSLRFAKAHFARSQIGDHHCHATDELFWLIGGLDA